MTHFFESFRSKDTPIIGFNQFLKFQVSFGIKVDISCEQIIYAKENLQLFYGFNISLRIFMPISVSSKDCYLCILFCSQAKASLTGEKNWVQLLNVYLFIYLPLIISV